MSPITSICAIYKSSKEIFVISFSTLGSGIHMVGDLTSRLKRPVEFPQLVRAIEHGLAAYRTGVQMPEDPKSIGNRHAVSLGFRSYSHLCSRVEYFIIACVGSEFTLSTHLRARGGFNAYEDFKSIGISEELVAPILK